MAQAKDKIKSVRMPSNIAAWIEEEAAFEGISANAYIIEVLSEKMQDRLDYLEVVEIMKDPESHEYVSREEMMRKYGER